jgi:hypothetical protein
MFVFSDALVLLLAKPLFCSSLNAFSLKESMFDLPCDIDAATEITCEAHAPSDTAPQVAA